MEGSGVWPGWVAASSRNEMYIWITFGVHLGYIYGTFGKKIHLRYIYIHLRTFMYIYIHWKPPLMRCTSQVHLEYILHTSRCTEMYIFIHVGTFRPEINFHITEKRNVHLKYISSTSQIHLTYIWGTENQKYIWQSHRNLSTFKYI